MDGPGQWPPPAELVEGADEAIRANSADPDLPLNHLDAAGAVETFEPAAGLSLESAPAMAPADMGLPLWTPEPAPQAEPAEPAPVARPAAATAPGSGMSSVREIDAFAGVPIPEPAAAAQEAVAGPADHADAVEFDQFAGADDAIAALIAEADSLEAAAGLATSDVIELDAAADEIVAPLVEFSAVDSDAAIELAAIEESTAIQLSAEEFPSPAVFAGVEPEAITEADEVWAEPVVESAADAVLAESTELEVAAVLAEPAVQAEGAPEVQAVAALSEVEPETEQAVVAAEAASIVSAEPAAATVIPIAAAVSVARSGNERTIIALEQLLGRVQARRLQLVSQSVA
jgi:hypothetical protein